MSRIHRTTWVRPSTRAALYTRDQWCCAWCGAGIDTHGLCPAPRIVVPDLVLTLDHLRPACIGGTNAPSNLVTACWECNNDRGAASALAFLAWLDAMGRDALAARRRIVRRGELSPAHRALGLALDKERPLWYARLKARSRRRGARARWRQEKLPLPGEIIHFPEYGLMEPCTVAALAPF